MVGHKNCRQHGPLLKLCYRRVECAKGRVVRQHRLTIRDANCDEINNVLLPASPDGNSWRMSHASTSLAGGAPALQRFSATALQLIGAVGQAHRLPPKCNLRVWLRG